jgi:hypothetical protein
MSVDKLDRKTEMTLSSQASHSKSALSQARQRINSTNQCGRPTPGAGTLRRRRRGRQYLLLANWRVNC